MKNTLLIACLIVFDAILISCTINPEVKLEDRMIVDHTEQKWLQEGMPDAGECLEGVGIRTLSSSNFNLQCGKSAFLSIGCVQDRGVGHSGGKILYLSPNVKPTMRKEAIVHLTLHALCSCTATRHGDLTDELHTRKKIWLENSENSSIENTVIKEIN